MKAVVQHRYGTVDTWGIEELPAPTPAAHEVLVRVRAAGVDRGTWHLMTGLPLLLRLGFGLRGPRVPVPGRDLAGVVEAVGPGVSRLAVGDEVFGTTGRGSFAELARAREDKVAIKPPGLSFAQAAAVPVSGVTALQGLRDVGRIRAGQRVLIVGASGGVGSYAVQLAKAFGAEVTGVCSTAKVDLVRALGADHVIDYTRAEIDEGGRCYELVLDTGGNRPVSQLRAVLAERGTLVIVGGEGGDRWLGGFHRQLAAAARSPFLRHRLAMFVAKENATDLEMLAELATAGTLRPAVERSFPLEEAAAAMTHLESGQVRGKVVVAI